MCTNVKSNNPVRMGHDAETRKRTFPILLVITGPKTVCLLHGTDSLQYNLFSLSSPITRFP